MSNENNAGIDLAQLDTEKLLERVSRLADWIKPVGKGSAEDLRTIIDLARRASATPSSKDAGGELVQAARRLHDAAYNFNASKFVLGSKEHHAAAHEFQAAEDNIVRLAIAAPVHDAAAPSAEQDLRAALIELADVRGKLIDAYAELSGLGKLAGAAAKTEQDDELRREVAIMYQMLDDGEWAEHIARTPHGQCLETAITKALSRASAAGAGSEQPLPPLPRNYGRFNVNGPDEHRIRGWTSEQMQEYGRACYALARAPLPEQGENVAAANAGELDLDDLDNTAKEALRDLSHVENHLEQSDAPTTVKNRAVDVRLCVKELRAALKDRAAATSAGGLQAAYDALRFYVDASDAEMAERGISRADALRLARDAEAAALARAPLPAQDGQAVDDARDAARYRFLRDSTWSERTYQEDGSCWVVQYHHPKGTIPELRSAGFGRKLDATVDAAMSASRPDDKGAGHE